MEELLRQKEELSKKLADLNGEIRMGEILGDQEMIDSASTEITELNQRISEIEKEIKRKEVEEKYPAQYLYERILSMSDEELQKYASDQLALNKKQNDSLQKELEELQSDNGDLAIKLENINNRLSSIKEEYKETHNEELFDVARKLVAKKKELEEKIEALKEKLESKEKELEELGPSEMSSEEIRQGMIAQIDGNYKAEDSTYDGEEKDTEGYSDEQKVLSEIRQEAIKDSQEEKDKIIGSTVSEELEDIEFYKDDEDDIKVMKK